MILFFEQSAVAHSPTGAKMVTDQQVHEFAQKFANAGFEDLAYKGIRTLEKDPTRGKERCLQFFSDSIPSSFMDLKHEAGNLYNQATGRPTFQT